MSRKVVIKSLMGWIGLMAYLFVCLLSAPAVLAITSSIAGSHGCSVLDNGTEKTIIFTHPGAEQSHANSEVQSEALGSESASVFYSHQKPHADHVIHLPSAHEEAGTLNILQTIHSNYLTDLVGLPERPTPLSFFLQAATLEVLPQPPPHVQPSALEFLQNIRLLI